MTDNLRAYISIQSVSDSDPKQIQQMKIIWNAVVDGWIVKKREGKFYFSKKQSDVDFSSDCFLENFIEKYSF